MDIQQAYASSSRYGGVLTHSQTMAMGTVRFPNITYFGGSSCLKFDVSLKSLTLQVMIMKMHSYMTVNGSLQHVSSQSRSLFKQLQDATVAVGGWDAAVSAAMANRAAIDAATGFASNSDEETPSGTPPLPSGAILASGLQSSFVDVDTAANLRKRLDDISTPAAGSQTVNDKKSDDHPISLTNPHPLIDHPSKNISSMARDYSELMGDLTSTGPYPVTWPENITLKNFCVYQLIPSLVYELEYPRTEK